MCCRSCAAAARTSVLLSAALLAKSKKLSVAVVRLAALAASLLEPLARCSVLRAKRRAMTMGRALLVLSAGPSVPMRIRLGMFLPSSHAFPDVVGGGWGGGE